MVSHIPYISLDTYPKVRGTRIKDVAMLIPFTSREPAMFCLIALVLEFYCLRSCLEMFLSLVICY